MEQTPVTILSERSVQDLELVVMPHVDAPASSYETSYSPAPAASERMGTVGEREGCADQDFAECLDSTTGSHDKNETSAKMVYGNSEKVSSESISDNFEVQKPQPSVISGVGDTVVIPTSSYEISHPTAPGSFDLSSAGVTVREVCDNQDKSNHSDNTYECHGKSEASQVLIGSSGKRASESLVDNSEDQHSSCVSKANDAVMIINADDDPDISTISQQEVYVDFKSIPFQITGVWKEFEHPTQNNFTKGCKWSPDGSCILSCSEDAKMRLFNLPMEMYQTSIDWTNLSEMFSVVQVSESELIYDYCWYPHMSSLDPVSCCFVSSSRYNPVHMWDAFTGEMRCTYRSYNHVDEIVAAHSLAFDSDGQKLYCGFKNMIRIFNVAIPGRSFQELPTCVKKIGQKGIISCFAFSAENKSVFAAGSYSKTAGIYSETDGSLIHLLDQQNGGITHMCFSPDGCKLFCGGRKDPEILCWDMRNLKKPLFRLRRICNNNQRMYFDVSRCGQYVASGNNNGVVTIWDIKDPSKQVHIGESVILEPVQFYQAHKDCANGISFHPNLPIMATSSGQRQFPELLDSEGEESGGAMFTDKDIVKDNSIRLWWVGPCT